MVDVGLRMCSSRVQSEIAPAKGPFSKNQTCQSRIPAQSPDWRLRVWKKGPDSGRMWLGGSVARWLSPCRLSPSPKLVSTADGKRRGEHCETRTLQASSL
jgi:hypothetical protein